MKPLFGYKRRFPMGSLLLIKARKESGLKQAEFIERYGLEVTQPTFSRWESGKQQVPFDVLLKVGAIKPIEIA
ncbi:TPA: helix-turn-helix transcriptional regulator [Vibrio vulnificus]|nr:helix-turn-helix transcriptional regulator [Vibrio vulnificus]